MPVTSTDIVNQAAMMIGGNQPLVTGTAPNFDSSTVGKAAAQIYTPCVQTVGRQFGWDMARNTVQLTTATGTAPFPWSAQYLYPSNGIQVWQLVLTSADPNNPLPLRWAVGNALVSGNQTKCIFCNITSAATLRAIYNNNPSESLWDPGFREAVVRLLASELAMAIAGKPDASQALLQSGSAFESIAERRSN